MDIYTLLVCDENEHFAKHAVELGVNKNIIHELMIYTEGNKKRPNRCKMFIAKIEDDINVLSIKEL